MSYEVAAQKKKRIISNSKLLLIGFATAFFPRLPTYFGAPSLLNFAHFVVVPAVIGIALLTTRVKDRKRIAICWELIFGMGIFLVCNLVSALLNQAGIANVLLQILLQI